MAEFIITRKQKDYLKMPYQVIINGRPVGTMRTPQAKLHLPAGFYTVTIRTGSYVPVGKKGKTIDMTFSTTEAVKISDTGYNCLDFKDKGRWWDIVFGIDLAVWFVALFLTIPHPWNIVYHIVSDGFFVAWLIRLLLSASVILRSIRMYRPLRRRRSNRGRVVWSGIWKSTAMRLWHASSNSMPVSRNAPSTVSGGYIKCSNGKRNI